MVSRAALSIVSRVPVYFGIAARSASAPLAVAAPATRGLSSDVEQHSNWCSKSRLTVATMNPHVRRMEYAVRGPLPTEAARIVKDIEEVRFI